MSARGVFTTTGIARQGRVVNQPAAVLGTSTPQAYELQGRYPVRMAAAPPEFTLYANLRSISEWIETHNELPPLETNDAFVGFSVEIMNRTLYLLRTGVALAPDGTADRGVDAEPRHHPRPHGTPHEALRVLSLTRMRRPS